MKTATKKAAEKQRMATETALKKQGTATRVAPAKPRKRRGAAPKVGFVSLGCPKALVDSERILTQLRAEGYLVAPSYQDADLVVVNTCGFIDSAVAESLDAIGEALAKTAKSSSPAASARRAAWCWTPTLVYSPSRGRMRLMKSCARCTCISRSRLTRIST